MLTAFGQKKSAYKYAHGAVHDLPDGPVLADSSRYNTNTGRLTPAMLRDIRERLT